MPLPQALAQEIVLPMPGTMVHLSSAFNPLVLKGIKVHPDNPFKFDFILDKGEGSLSDRALKDESTKLIKYFLASLTTPEKDMWVNLSPYEKDRIVPESFGQTEMGRDLLAQDYILKQITASLIYPEDQIGKQFWKRVYEESAKKYGNTNIPVNTFNKVWIVPEKAVVYENAKAGTAYVVESSLKVMLESDYLSASKHQANETNDVGKQIVREVVIPQLIKEVNEGQNFAQLRQVYNSLILAAWYKKKIKDSILSQVYQDQNKTAGIAIDDPQEKQKIYEQYLQAFKKGAYNYIKEERDSITKQMVPRKYFSGGVQLMMLGKGTDSAMVINQDASMISKLQARMASVGSLLLLSASLQAADIQNLPSQKDSGKNQDIVFISPDAPRVVLGRQDMKTSIGTYSIVKYSQNDWDRFALEDGIKNAFALVNKRLQTSRDSNQEPILVLKEALSKLKPQNVGMFKVEKVLTGSQELTAYSNADQIFVSVDQSGMKLVASIIHEVLHSPAIRRIMNVSDAQEEDWVIRTTLSIVGSNTEVTFKKDTKGEYRTYVYSLNPNLSIKNRNKAIREEVIKKFQNRETDSQLKDFLTKSFPDVISRMQWINFPAVKKLLEVFNKINKEDPYSLAGSFMRSFDEEGAKSFIHEIAATSENQEEFNRTLGNYLAFDMIRTIIQSKPQREELYQNRLNHEARKMGKQIVDKRSLAIVLSDEQDWNGALKQMGGGSFAINPFVGMTGDLIMQGFRVLVVDVKSLDQVVRSITDFTQFEPASVLVLNAHGDPQSLGGWLTLPGGKPQRKESVLITSEIERQLKNRLKGKIKTTILASCSTGGSVVEESKSSMKKRNIADLMASITGAVTYAATDVINRLSVDFKNGNNPEVKFFGSKNTDPYMKYKFNDFEERPISTYIAKPDNAMMNEFGILNKDDFVEHSGIIYQGKPLKGDTIFESLKMNRRGFLKFATAIGVSVGAGLVHIPVKAADDQRKTFSATDLNKSKRANEIVRVELQKIFDAKRMRNDIISDDYWKEVFGKDQDLFMYALDDIQLVLDVGLEPYRNTGRITAEEFSRLALDILRNKQKMVEYFFKGSFSRFIIAEANQDLNIKERTAILIARGYLIDQKLGEMMEMVSDVNNKQNPKLYEKWRLFNEDFLSRYEIYGTLRPSSLKGKIIYFPVIYSIVRTEPFEFTPNLSTKIVFGKKLDRINTKGAVGHQIDGESVVFVDIDEVEEMAKKYKNDIKGVSVEQARRYIEADIIRHELTHKYQELTKENFVTRDNFGIPNWDRLEESDRKGIEAETLAYLVQMRFSKAPGIVIKHLAEHFKGGRATKEYFAARYILNQIARKLMPGNRQITIEDVIQEALSSNKLNEYAAQMINDSKKMGIDVIGKYKPDNAMGVEDVKQKGGIDLNPNKLIFNTQNDRDNIKFKIDAAMLEQLRNSKGFSPIIIDMKSLPSLPSFLGIIGNTENGF